MKYKLNKKAVFVIVVIFLLSIIGLYIYSRFYTTTGYSEIKNMQNDNGNYYIYVQNNNGDLIELECNKNEYEKIEIDSDLVYGISYKWTVIFPNKGKLLYLNLNDTIDNRE